MGGRGVTGQSCAEILAVSWSGVVYILALSEKERGINFVLNFFCKVEQLNYIQCAAILNTALNTSITQSSHYETHHSASIKCTNIKENNEVLLK